MAGPRVINSLTPVSHQPVVVIALRHKVKKVSRSFDDALRVGRTCRDVNAYRTFYHDFFIPYLKLNF